MRKIRRKYYIRKSHTKMNGYKCVKNGGAFVRSNFSANPTEVLNSFGIIGRVLALIFSKIFAKLIHTISRLLTGTIYEPRKHPAWVGSIVYTIIFLALMGLVSGFVSLFVNC